MPPPRSQIPLAIHCRLNDTLDIAELCQSDVGNTPKQDIYCDDSMQDVICDLSSVVGLTPDREQ